MIKLTSWMCTAKLNDDSTVMFEVNSSDVKGRGIEDHIRKIKDHEKVMVENLYEYEPGFWCVDITFDNFGTALYFFSGDEVTTNFQLDRLLKGAGNIYYKTISEE